MTELCYQSRAGWSLVGLIDICQDLGLRIYAVKVISLQTLQNLQYTGGLMFAYRINRIISTCTKQLKVYIHLIVYTVCYMDETTTFMLCDNCSCFSWAIKLPLVFRTILYVSSYCFPAFSAKPTSIHWCLKRQLNTLRDRWIYTFKQIIEANCYDWLTLSISFLFLYIENLLFYRWIKLFKLQSIL